MPKQRSRTSMGQAVAWIRTNPQMKNSPTVSEIARATDLPKRAIRDAINELEANGIVVKKVYSARGEFMVLWTDWYAEERRKRDTEEERSDGKNI